jgi:hypothetical protein
MATWRFLRPLILMRCEMRTTKAIHRAAAKSLDGHVRFVATVGRTPMVMTLSELAHCPKARIQVAFSCGKCVVPR